MGGLDSASRRSAVGATTAHSHTSAGRVQQGHRVRGQVLGAACEQRQHYLTAVRARAELSNIVLHNHSALTGCDSGVLECCPNAGAHVEGHGHAAVTNGYATRTDRANMCKRPLSLVCTCDMAAGLRWANAQSTFNIARERALCPPVDLVSSSPCRPSEYMHQAFSTTAGNHTRLGHL